MKLAKFIPFLIFMFLIACAKTAPTRSPAAAVRALEQSATYRYDGANITVLTSTQDTVLLGFETTHAGYGDRSEVKLPLQESLHTATVHLQSGNVVSILIDGIWDELAQKPIDQEVDGSLQARMQQSCGEDIPSPIVTYINQSVHINYFSKTGSCGLFTVTYQFDNRVYPPLLTVIPGDPMGKCIPMNCSILGTSAFVIPAKSVGVVVIHTTQKNYITPFGGMRCRTECPQGYICAYPERGGICIINSTEDTNVLYERYVNITN